VDKQLRDVEALPETSARDMLALAVEEILDDDAESTAEAAE
jgi:hypothetical protein